jgi:hypothetical protein
MPKDAPPNGDAPAEHDLIDLAPVGPRRRVSEMQANLHRRAADPGRRFDDLFPTLGPGRLNQPHGRHHGEPGAVKAARRVRRAAWGNGPAAMPAPRPRPTPPYDCQARRKDALGDLESAHWEASQPSTRRAQRAFGRSRHRRVRNAWCREPRRRRRGHDARLTGRPSYSLPATDGALVLAEDLRCALRSPLAPPSDERGFVAAVNAEGVPVVAMGAEEPVADVEAVGPVPRAPAGDPVAAVEGEAGELAAAAAERRL